jgi:hypothetical protein
MFKKDVLDDSNTDNREISLMEEVLNGHKIATKEDISTQEIVTSTIEISIDSNLKFYVTTPNDENKLAQLATDIVSKVEEVLVERFADRTYSKPKSFLYRLVYSDNATGTCEVFD